VALISATTSSLPISLCYQFNSYINGEIKSRQEDHSREVLIGKDVSTPGVAQETVSQQLAK
jgi:hypothetical protein